MFNTLDLHLHINNQMRLHFSLPHYAPINLTSFQPRLNAPYVCLHTHFGSKT